MNPHLRYIVILVIAALGVLGYGSATGAEEDLVMEQCVVWHNTESPFVGDDYVFDFEENREKATHEKFPLKYEH